ncbi:MAG: hypothetical protein R3190_13375 [Thermoanaerobaculia bacterium]|nr:hypothetical protein [Thermoanaerobaculia bacterium]
MRKIITFSLVAVLLAVLPALAADEPAIKRLPNGKPDFSGVYDAGTVTPVDRPPQFGNNLYLTPEEAQKLEERQAAFWANAEASKGDGANREAPPVGGDGDNRFGGGGVGGYNIFWIDPGSEAVMVDGKFRTSIIYEPENGRRPPMTPAAMKKMMANFASFAHNNDGTASWLDKEGPGPFDGPESLALAERCLLGFSGGPPMLPSLYNNYLSITQTEDHVVIMAEMVHDARIARMNGEHRPETPENRRWLGDPIAYWEGDTLVVESKNFRSHSGLPGADENLHVVERFTPTPEGDVLYNFRVDDPTAWTAPWAGEYTWRKKDSKVYEYACHEGNYAMGNVLRGARLLESEYESPSGR